ncbi:nucleotidyltransferase family protein [Sphingomonas cannabina]|uniref:nucleotidyltransferase family protein n=1 Tax=Sphingomonas cannabina TaxID=2899123 RepID=UPI001F1EADB6|nr:nucleotidyltransferase family protein [Sphingomonas cannabina]UIJ45275.1 nucleotidyltransferase family protein [Sphingomonas cannabina]
MIRAEDTALVLLAAGRSLRFDGASRDKLAEEFLDKPLALHVVVALEAVPFKRRIAVVSGTVVDFAACGYEVVTNPEPERGMARSLHFGIDAAQKAGAEAVMIALADMPRVTAAHIYRLLDYASGPDAVLASSDGVAPRPPALFGRDHFDELMKLEGDQGARKIIAAAHHVITSEAELVDIDTVEDLQRLRRLYGLGDDGEGHDRSER